MESNIWILLIAIIIIYVIVTRLYQLINDKASDNDVDRRLPIMNGKIVLMTASR